MPDLDLPALRAVIAGVRENIDRWSEAVMVGCRRDSLTTLADACERLAEENERMRKALDALEAHHVEQNRQKRRDESRSTTLRLIRAAITPAPAGKAGDMSTGLTIDSSAPAGKGEG